MTEPMICTRCGAEADSLFAHLAGDLCVRCSARLMAEHDAKRFLPTPRRLRPETATHLARMIAFILKHDRGYGVPLRKLWRAGVTPQAKIHSLVRLALRHGLLSKTDMNGWYTAR